MYRGEDGRHNRDMKALAIGAKVDCDKCIGCIWVKGGVIRLLRLKEGGRRRAKRRHDVVWVTEGDRCHETVGASRELGYATWCCYGVLRAHMRTAGAEC